MDKAFKLVLNSSDIFDLQEKESSLVDKEPRNNKFNKIDSILDKDIDLTSDANRIINSWFPLINDADIFLSHSHKDEKQVHSFAKWLEYNFGLKSFIDSHFWGYADELLKKIDDKYCISYTNINTNTIYDYKKRNYSTSHVHMMLSTAIMEMINHCKCIIFINTPNSILSVKKIYTENKYGLESSEITNSPWIYFELNFIRFMLKKQGFQQLNENINFDYNVDLNFLTQINKEKLQKWKNDENTNPQKGKENLEILYKLLEK